MLESNYSKSLIVLLVTSGSPEVNKKVHDLSLTSIESAVLSNYSASYRNIVTHA
jgi:hypothetical protein